MAIPPYISQRLLNHYKEVDPHRYMLQAHSNSVVANRTDCVVINCTYNNQQILFFSSSSSLSAQLCPCPQNQSQVLEVSERQLIIQNGSDLSLLRPFSDFSLKEKREIINDLQHANAVNVVNVNLTHALGPEITIRI